MKKITAITLFLVLSIISFAQIIGPSFINNPLYHNPAYAGLEGATNFYLSNNKLSEGNLTNFSYNQALIDGKLGIGVNTNYLSSIIVMNTTEFNTNLSYHHNIGQKGKLSAGIAVGAERFSPSNSYLEFLNWTKDEFNTMFGNIILPEFGLGLNYSTSKGYLSISTPSILSTVISKEDENGNSIATSKYRELMISGGWSFYALEDKIKIFPSTIYQRHTINNSDLSINTLGLNMTFISNKKVRFNIGATSLKIGEESFQFNKLDLALGYMMKNGVRISGQLDIGKGLNTPSIFRIAGGGVNIGYRLSQKNNTETFISNHFF